MEYHDSTRCVRAGLPEPVPGAPLMPGPVFAAPYHLDPEHGPAEGQPGYGRPDNPTRERLETAIGELEGGQCLVFASGQAALTSLLLSQLTPGDWAVLPSDGYFSVRAFATATLRPRGVAVQLAPTAGPYPPLDRVRVLLVESPSNPQLDMCDVPELADTAASAGTLLAVDNTTATPLGQRPLELGADVVAGSGTKALAGHSDLLLGYLVTRDEELLGQLRQWRDWTGAVPGAFDCWLAHRSLATLDLRLARQSENAAAVAAMLASRSDVTGLRWPGLPGDPAHPVASRLLRRMPGVVSFDLGSAERVAAFLRTTELVTAATSFGGVHTTADRRAQWGDDVPPGFVRLSCGIEDTDDLLTDLAAALEP